MKKISLGQTLGILANLGVIAGILLLTYELNQNRQMMQSQTRNAIADTLVHLVSLEATTPEPIETEVKLESGVPLSRADAEQGHQQ